MWAIWYIASILKFRYTGFSFHTSQGTQWQVMSSGQGAGNNSPSSLLWLIAWGKRNPVSKNSFLCLQKNFSQSLQGRGQSVAASSFPNVSGRKWYPSFTLCRNDFNTYFKVARKSVFISHYTVSKGIKIIFDQSIWPSFLAAHHCWFCPAELLIG